MSVSSSHPKTNKLLGTSLQFLLELAAYLHAPLGLENRPAVGRVLVGDPEDEGLRGAQQKRDEPGHHDHLKSFELCQNPFLKK